MELRDRNGLTEAEFLAQYEPKDYPHPSLTADIALVREPHDDPNQTLADSLNSISRKLEILLIKRGGHPYLECWALPGGFVEEGETAETAAARELEEETGVADLPLEQLGVYSTPGRDPRGWTVTSAYISLVDEDVDVIAGDDAIEARWFNVRVKRVDGNLELTAKNDSATLHSAFKPVPRRFGPPRAKMVSADGFAFDHAQIVADAYLTATWRG
ncbi:MAG: NUDIX domain-containing protein [Coriobacteriales bacterium]|jgi:8-oxo-dGTP diphosphatase